MTEDRQAIWAETLPDGDDGARYFRVGGDLHADDGSKVPITSITVQRDVPGLHCNLDRVCIWCGDELAAEFPYLSAGAVGYI